MSDTEGVQILSGGKLVETRWVYDDEKGEGSYVDRDVTDIAPSYLFRECQLGDNLILKDILLLLESHIEIFNIVFGNWVDELVAEGLSEQTVLEDNDDITHLELYWFTEYDIKNEDFIGNVLPGFHGVGDDGVNYSISLSPVNKSVHYLLKLNDTFPIYDYYYCGTNGLIASYKKPKFLLGQILYGIIWELSWYGSPSDRNKIHDDMMSEVEGINNDTS